MRPTPRPDPNRRTALALLGAGAVCATTARASAQTFGEADYARAMVIDGEGVVLGGDAAAARDLAATGMTAVSVTVGRVGNAPGAFDSAVADIAALDGFADANPGAVLRVRNAADLAQAKTSGRLGLIYNTQDTSALEGDLSRIEALKGLGVRVVQLTYNKRGLAGDGCLESRDAGVSDFGRQVIGELNAKRLLLDLAHGGARTIGEATAITQAPPAVTHTGCRDLVDNPRNISDALMRGVAQKGGVVGIYMMSYLGSAVGHPAIDVRREDFVAHLEHALNVCGEDHIGIGTDGTVMPFVLDEGGRAFLKRHYEDRVAAGIVTPGDGPEITNTIAEYNTARRFRVVGDDLARRGWPAGRIEKVIGGNFARLFRDVWGG
jgi:membrane dipeptidase